MHYVPSLLIVADLVCFLVILAVVFTRWRPIIRFKVQAEVELIRLDFDDALFRIRRAETIVNRIALIMFAGVLAARDFLPPWAVTAVIAGITLTLLGTASWSYFVLKSMKAKRYGYPGVDVGLVTY